MVEPPPRVAIPTWKWARTSWCWSHVRAGNHMWGGRVTYRLRRVEGTLRMSYKKVVLVDKDKPLPTLGFLI